MILKRMEPIWHKGAYSPKLSVAVFCDFNETVVIVIKLSFVAVRQHLGDSLPTGGKTANDIVLGDVMAATFYTVFDSAETFIS